MELAKGGEVFNKLLEFGRLIDWLIDFDWLIVWGLPGDGTTEGRGSLG